MRGAVFFYKEKSLQKAPFFKAKAPALAVFGVPKNFLAEIWRKGLTRGGKGVKLCVTEQTVIQ